ncbi:MAG: fibronectin type III domain-containing protein [Ginsengibacter sp.]
MESLLFYDPAASKGEFYKVNVLGEIDLLATYTDWRNDWTQIIPGNFGGNGFTDLLFYESSTGTGQFYTTDGEGGISSMRVFNDWRHSWNIIVPGNFGGNGFTDLLFYDANAGTGEFYSTDGHGGITLLRQFIDWRNSWSQIIPGNFGGNGFDDLLFYDAVAGTGEFYTTDGHGGINQISQFTDWRQSWTKIIPGSFRGYGFTDLLFYEGSTGVIEFYTVDGHGGITRLGGNYTLPANLSQIVLNDYSNLFLYDSSAGSGKFFVINGQGSINLLKQITGLGNSWKVIVAGNFNNSTFNTLNSPSNLKVTEVADRKISISWMYQPSSESGFKIRYSGKLAGQSDDTGTQTVDSNVRTADLLGLDSGYKYTISIVAFNAAGESRSSNEVTATTPARVISVSKEGKGTLAVFTVNGTGFTPGSVVVNRATAPNFTQVQFDQTTGADGKYTARQSIPCISGVQITFTAFEDSNPTSTFANSVITTCP